MKFRPQESRCEMPPIELFRFERRFSQSELSRKARQELRWEDIRPVVRLAHHLDGTLNFGPRIIFDHMLLYIVSGRLRVTVGDRVVEGGPGWLFFLPPFEPHSCASGEKQRCEHISVHFDWAPRIRRSRRESDGHRVYEVVLPDSVRIPHAQLLPSCDGLPDKLERIVDLRKADDPVSLLHADAVLMEMTALLIEKVRNGGVPKTTKRPVHTNRVRVEAAIEWMKRTLGQPIDASAIAEVSGLSPSRFSCVFRDITGKSPMEFLTVLRVQRAKMLLGDWRLSIKEVAALCGFEDPYHFSKVFSRLDGMSPLQFRETILRPMEM